MKNNTITEISNDFTGYSATIRTNGMPAISTIRKHLRAAKCNDCQSTTRIFVNGQRYDIQDFGLGHVALTAY